METAEQKHGRPPDLLDWVIGRNHSFQAAKRVSVLEASVEIPLFSHWEKRGQRCPDSCQCIPNIDGGVAV